MTLFTRVVRILRTSVEDLPSVQRSDKVTAAQQDITDRTSRLIDEVDDVLLGRLPSGIWVEDMTRGTYRGRDQVQR